MRAWGWVMFFVSLSTTILGWYVTVSDVGWWVPIRFVLFIMGAQITAAWSKAFMQQYHALKDNP